MAVTLDPQLPTLNSQAVLADPAFSGLPGDIALALWEYCHDSARQLFAAAQPEALPDRLLRALRQSDQGLTRREITRLLGNNRTAAEVSAALASLAAQASPPARPKAADMGGMPSAGTRRPRGYPMTPLRHRICSYCSYCSYHSRTPTLTIRSLALIGGAGFSLRPPEGRGRPRAQRGALHAPRPVEDPLHDPPLADSGELQTCPTQGGRGRCQSASVPFCGTNRSDSSTLRLLDSSAVPGLTASGGFAIIPGARSTSLQITADNVAMMIGAREVPRVSQDRASRCTRACVPSLW
jgi:hypothetical protein